MLSAVLSSDTTLVDRLMQSILQSSHLQREYCQIRKHQTIALREKSLTTKLTQSCTKFTVLLSTFFFFFLAGKIIKMHYKFRLESGFLTFSWHPLEQATNSTMPKQHMKILSMKSPQINFARKLLIWGVEKSYVPQKHIFKSPTSACTNRYCNRWRWLSTS